MIPFQKHDIVFLLTAGKGAIPMIVERIKIKDIDQKEETTYAVCLWVKKGKLCSRSIHYSLLRKAAIPYNEYYKRQVLEAKENYLKAFKT